MARYTLTLTLAACVLVAFVAAQSSTTTTAAPTSTTTTTAASTTTTTAASTTTTTAASTTTTTAASTTTTTAAPTTTTTTAAPTTTTTASGTTTTAAPTTTTTASGTTTTAAPTTTTTASGTTTTASGTTTTASGTTTTASGTTTTAAPTTTTTASGTTTTASGTTTTASGTTTTASGTTTTTTAAPTTTTTAAPSTTTTTAAPTTASTQSLVNIGRVTYFLGNGTTAGAQNGADTSAFLNRPLGCAIDNAGNFYFADTLNSVVRRVASGSSTTTSFVGTLNVTGDVQANGTSARFGSPYTFRFTPDFTTAFVTDFAKHKILKVTIATTEVTLFAGLASGLPGDTDATGTAAAFNAPGDLVIRATSLDMYVTEVGGNRVRKVTSAAVTTLFAGNANGTSGYTDATAGAAFFNSPIGIVALESDGRLFVADSVNKVIRAIDSAAAVTTVAGSQSAAVGNVDGVGSVARFVEVWGLALDRDATFVFIADKGNNVIRRMTVATFQVVTVVGTLNPGWTSATVSTNALIASPNSLCFGTVGSQSRLYITGDHSISFVALSRTLTVTMTLPATPSPNGTTTTAPTTTRAPTTGPATGPTTTRPSNATTIAPTPRVENGTTAAPTTTSGSTTAPPSLSAAPAQASLLVAAVVAAAAAVFAF